VLWRFSCDIGIVVLVPLAYESSPFDVK